MAILMLGDAYDILLISTICFTIIGMNIILTETPLSMIKLIHGIPKNAYNFISFIAVNEKTGAKADQMIGNAKFFTGF